MLSALYCRYNVLLITLFCNVQEAAIWKKCHNLQGYKTIQNVKAMNGNFDLRVWHCSNASTIESKKLRNMKTKWIPNI